MYRRPGRGRLLLLAFVILSILIVTLSFQKDVDGPLEKARDVASSIVSPIQRGVTVVVRPVRNFFSSLGDLGNLRSENEELNAQVDEAEARLERVESLEEEVQELRALADMKAAWFTMDSVDAEVIGNTAANYKWAVTINKGSDSGIEINMAVVDSTGSVVGKTIDVTDNTASVLLLIDPESGATSDTKNAIGSLKGNGADEDFSLEFISPEEKVTVGETVTTSGKDQGVFPAGIPIGKVSYVGDDSGGIEQVVEVEPFVSDFNDIQFVKVLLGSGPELQAKGSDK